MLRIYMKNKFTKEEIEEAYVSLISNQSMVKTVFGASLGFLGGVILYYIFAQIGATFIILLFVPPVMVGFLSGEIGKPYDFKHKLITCVFGVMTYFIGLYWIFIAYNPFLLLLTPVAGFISVYFSGLHINEVQKRAIWKKQYE